MSSGWRVTVEWAVPRLPVPARAAGEQQSGHHLRAATRAPTERGAAFKALGQVGLCPLAYWCDHRRRLVLLHTARPNHMITDRTEPLLGMVQSTGMVP